MESPEKSRSYAKREIDGSDGRRDMAGDDDDWEGNGKRKHKSSKSKKSSNGEDTDGWDGIGRRKSSGERNESRRLSGGSSRGDIDEGDYDLKKESSSKQGKKKQEASALEKLSNWYQDGELESRHDGGDKSGKSHARSDDNDKNTLRRTSSKLSDHEGSHRRSKSKDEKAREGEDDKALDKDSCHSERRESSREKGHGLSEDVRGRRRWDEPDTTTKADNISCTGKHESGSEIGCHTKLEGSRERDSSSRVDTSERKDRVLESANDRSELSNREERGIDSDRSKSRSRSDAVEEDYKSSLLTREDGAGKDKVEKHREQRTGRDAPDNRDRLSNVENDGSLWMRDKTSKEVGYSRRSRTPERSGRHRHESENSEIEYERSSSIKRKEPEKDGFRDDRGKSREGSWSDRSREREGSRDIWKRRQQAGSDRDVDSVHDHDRDRELPRRGRDRMENERPLGRVGNRKDGRSEAVKASSNFGISTENYDVIEIQPKPLDYGRDDPGSALARRTEAVPLHGPKTTAHDEWAHSQDDPSRFDGHRPSSMGDDLSGKCVEAVPIQDQNAWRDEGRPRSQQGTFPARSSGGQSSSGGSLPSQGNQDPTVSGRMVQQGLKGNRIGRGSRARPPGRDNQQVNIPVPMMGSPFGHLGMPPPGPIQPLNPGMPPAPGPPVPPGVFVSPFSPPVVWPGGRGVDMSMLPVSPGVSPLPPGPSGQRFPPNLGAPNPALFFNQPGQGRGMPPNASAPGLNAIVPVVRGNSNDKNSGGWIPPKSGGPPGKAPSRGEQNDYSQNFVDTGMRPQNFIRELELTNVEDYPKLRELIQKKDEIVAKAATPPMYYKSDLREFVLSPEFFGTKFDVILVDPPWEEYVHRAPGVTDHMEYWTFEEIINLKIEVISLSTNFLEKFSYWRGKRIGNSNSSVMHGYLSSRMSMTVHCVGAVSFK